MRILLLTKNDRAVASARLWFFQMHQILLERGEQVDINHFGDNPYDIIVIHRCVPELLKRALLHSPKAHIGIFPPGLNPPPEINGNVDFYVITSLLWKELLLPFNKRVYQHFDFFDPRAKACKDHKGKDGLILGYHGNEGHYTDNFFPNVSEALRRLAREFDFTLKVVIQNPETKPRIDGVNSVFVPWQLDTFEEEIASFDIGICPAISNMKELGEPANYIRNPNRVVALLFYGIPSVTSPIPQSLQVLAHTENTFFATSEEGWYQAVRQLIVDPDLRNRMGRAGYEMVQKKFTFDAAADAYLEIFRQEMLAPTFSKDSSVLKTSRKSKYQKMFRSLKHRVGM